MELYPHARQKSALTTSGGPHISMHTRIALLLTITSPNTPMRVLSGLYLFEKKIKIRAKWAVSLKKRNATGRHRSLRPFFTGLKDFQCGLDAEMLIWAVIWTNGSPVSAAADSIWPITSRESINYSNVVEGEENTKLAPAIGKPCWEQKIWEDKLSKIFE